MSKITQIQNTGQRVVVYVDHKFCVSIRPDVWKLMNLHEGSEITCSELKRKETFYFKKTYMLSSWSSEKERVDDVVKWLTKYLPEVEIKRIEQDEETMINEFHKMEPNLSLLLKGTKTEFIAIKVLGADVQVGTHHWLRLDAIEYIKENPSRDIWIAACFKYPKLNITWIKLKQEKEYCDSDKDKEGFVFFNHHASECHTSDRFCKYIKEKVKKELEKSGFIQPG
jgi:hypothetical protein